MKHNIPVITCISLLCAGCMTSKDTALPRGQSRLLECDSGYMGEIRINREGEIVFRYRDDGARIIEVRCNGAKTEMFEMQRDDKRMRLHLLIGDGTNITHTVVKQDERGTYQTIDRDFDGIPDRTDESEQQFRHVP